MGKLALLVALCGLVFTPVVRADDGVDAYLAGLGALAEGKFERAAEELGKAAAAQPGVVGRQLGHGIALVMLGRGEAAREALGLAEKLEPQNAEVRAWSAARATLFDAALPAAGQGPPPRDVAYAPKLIIATLGSRSPDAGDRARARAALEEVAREFAKGRRDGVEAVRALYAARRYREALAAAEALRVRRPGDGVVLGLVAHCKLGLKEYAAARQAYTEALRAFPTEAGYLIGRARSEAMVGAVAAAEADLALARRVGAKPMAALLTDAEGVLAKVKATGPTVVEPAGRAEQATRERCGLELDVREQPDRVEGLLALVRFHLQPTAVCEVTVGGRAVTARVPCGAMDLAKAEEALARAVKVAPDQPAVVLERARVEFAKRREDDMRALAERALAGGAVDLEVSVACLQYDVAAAKRMAAEAARIRGWGRFYDKQLDNGKWIKMWDGPTGDDLARARDLDRRAKAMHADATRGLQVLQKQTAGAADARSKAVHHLTNAYHDFWFGNLDGAIRAAEEALAADPANVHALRFLVGACGKAQSLKAKQYQAMLDEVDIKR